MHTYIFICIHLIHTYVCMHTYIFICIHMYIHSIHTHRRIHMHIQTLTHPPKRKHTHIHTHNITNSNKDFIAVGIHPNGTGARIFSNKGGSDSVHPSSREVISIFLSWLHDAKIGRLPYIYQKQRRESSVGG